MARLERVEGARVLVAELDGAVAGLIAFCPTHLLEHERPSCRITALVVQPHARRRGSRNGAARRGPPARVLPGGGHLPPDRRKAHRLYERCGFCERPRRFVKELG
jgi:GNAT superfamily N-acetyltransferase